MNMNKKGFTLVELLVVIVIIGLLSTLAIVALNSARAKARDAKRVSDVKQIQTALELFFNEHNGYPEQTTGIALGGASYDHLCSGSATATNNNFVANECATDAVTLMALVPASPTPPSTSAYTYTSSNTSGTYEEDYTITFSLEESVGNLSGSCTADPSGLVCSGS